MFYPAGKCRTLNALLNRQASSSPAAQSTAGTRDVSHELCSRQDTAAAPPWGNLTDIGEQSFPAFNLGETLGFVSDCKSQQMGLPVHLLLHRCIKSDLPLLPRVLHSIVFWW